MENLFHGVCRFEYIDGYTLPLRMTKEHEQLFYWHLPYVDRLRSTASVTVELYTSAKTIKFDYKFFNKDCVGTFGAYVNGFLTQVIEKGNLLEGSVEFNFDEGEKHVEIYFPYSAVVGVKNFFVDGEYKIVNDKKPKVLFYGDSITQGARAWQTGHSYVNVVKRELNYEVLNWGIGGYVFDKDLIIETNFKPDKIVVSLGTNNSHSSKEDNEKTIKEFFEKLNAFYPNVPVLAIIPAWMGKYTDKQLIEYKRIKELICINTKPYSQMQVVSAYDMIPHLAEYFSDDLLHPNAFGMETYGINLSKKIKEIDF